MTLQEYKKQKMQNPDFSAAYDEIQPEMDIIRAIIDARISQNMTQKELSERTGINQLLPLWECVPVLLLRHTSDRAQG